MREKEWNRSVIVLATFIKVGKKYGRAADGSSFDDSELHYFTSLHALHTIEIRVDEEGLESYQFRYSSPLHGSHPTESGVHGDSSLTVAKPFSFEGGKRVSRVEGHVIERMVPCNNGSNVPRSIITGLKFFSEDVASLSYDGPSGEKFNESFPGYTLGYVKGNSAQCNDESRGQNVNQIQFVWYRTQAMR